MKKVKVELAQKSYEIYIGADLLSKAGDRLRDMGYSGKTLVITDTMVKELYAHTLYHGLTGAGFSVSVLDVPAGEEQKTLESAGALYQKLTEV